MSAENWLELATLAITILGLLGVWKKLSAKIETVSEENSELDVKFFELVAAQMHSMAAQREPEKLRGIDIEFADGRKYVALLIMGEWVQISSGVKLIGLYERNGETTYLVQIDNIWRLRSHSHSEDELLEIISGIVTDKTTGRIYKKGETWKIPRGEAHAAEFEAVNRAPCLIKVTTIPALKRLEETPLMLDDMEGLVAYN